MIETIGFQCMCSNDVPRVIGNQRSKECCSTNSTYRGIVDKSIFFASDAFSGDVVMMLVSPKNCVGRRCMCCFRIWKKGRSLACFSSKSKGDANNVAFSSSSVSSWP